MIDSYVRALHHYMEKHDVVVALNGNVREFDSIQKDYPDKVLEFRYAEGEMMEAVYWLQKIHPVVIYPASIYTLQLANDQSMNIKLVSFNENVNNMGYKKKFQLCIPENRDTLREMFKRSMLYKKPYYFVL